MMAKSQELTMLVHRYYCIDLFFWKDANNCTVSSVPRTLTHSCSAGGWQSASAGAEGRAGEAVGRLSCGTDTGVHGQDTHRCEQYCANN